MSKALRRLAALACVAALAVAGESEKGAESAEGEPRLEVGTKVGQRIPQFEAEIWDVSGEETKKTTFDSHQLEKPTVLVFVSRTCPWVKLYQDRLSAMAKDYAKQGMQFVMVYPTRKTPAAKKIEYHKAAGFPTGMVNDGDASIAAKLKITKTPEVVLMRKNGEIVFRGGIDDSPSQPDAVKKAYLKQACDDLLAGREVSVTSAPLYG